MNKQEEAINLAKEAMKEVVSVCNESFIDSWANGGHTTVSLCPLCGGRSMCDEYCPKLLCVKALKKIDELEKNE